MDILKYLNNCERIRNMERYYYTIIKGKKEFLSVDDEKMQFTFRKLKEIEDCEFIKDSYEFLELRRKYLNNDLYRMQWGDFDKLIWFAGAYVSNDELNGDLQELKRNIMLANIGYNDCFTI